MTTQMASVRITATAHGAGSTTNVQHVEMLSAPDAATFYTQRCQSLGQNCNPTFLKQLLSGTVIFEFDNGYLGNQGIVPIMETLRRVPLHELLLPQCALTTTDYIVMCDAFVTHPTLQHIDLRGNSVEVTSAKKILMLIGRNTVITEVDLDETTPKYAAIQQQLARNRRQPFTMDKCLVCEKAVQHLAQNDTERKFLSAIIDLYSPMQYAISTVEFESVFRLVQRCCEQGRGLIFLCSGKCLEELANLVYAGARCVLKACHFHVDYTLPKLQFLHAYTQRLIVETASRNLDASAFEAPRLSQGATPAGVKRGATADTATERDVTTYFDASVDGNSTGSTCTVCGKETPTLAVGASLLLEHLAKDVRSGAPLGPSAVLRLVRVFVEHSYIRPCSRKCTKQVERYALFGFGGVVRRQPAGTVPLLTSIGVTMDCTATDFTIIDFERESVDSVDEEETVCARGVASAVGDIDNAPVDPYLLFAVARKLRKQAASTVGVELQATCEAACLIGCLEGSESPFCSDSDGVDSVASQARPSRGLYSTWDNLCAYQEARCGSGSVATLLRTAFSHRRSGFFQVDGPHRHNLFDNVRAALWTFRRQRRSVLTVMKFALNWLGLKDGVVPDTCPPKGGFYTCVKVVGQCLIENEFRLVVQGFFGPTAGHHGYFYLSKYMFNISAKEGAYMFVDGVALFANESAPVSLADTQEAARKPPGCAVATHDAADAVTSALHGCRAVRLLSKYIHHDVRLSPTQAAPLRALLASLPVSASAVLEDRTAYTAGDTSAVWRLLTSSLQHRLLPSQLLFVLSEQLGPDGIAWLLNHFPSSAAPASVATNPVVMLEAQAGRTQDAATQSSTEWRHANPTSVDWAAVNHAERNAAAAAQSAAHMYADAPVETIAQAAPGGKRAGSASRKKPRVPMPPTTTAGMSRKRDADLKTAETDSARSKTSLGDANRKTPSKGGSSGSRPSSSPSGRAEGGLRGAAQELKFDDPRQHSLAQLWAVERLQQKRFSQHDTNLATVTKTHPLGARLSGSPMTLGTSSTFASYSSPSDSHVSASFHHQRWTAMCLFKPDEDGNATSDTSNNSSLVALVIGDSFAVYDCRTQNTVVPLSQLGSHPLFSAFPFPAGCDTVVHHPLRPREVFVFSGSFWAVWDSSELVVVAGPFDLTRHEQFRRLPPEFLDGIDGAIPAFGTPYVLFFKQERFVLFDVDQRRCVTDVRHVHSAPPEPPSRAAQASTASYADSAGANAKESLPPLILDSKLSSQLDTAPLASLPAGGSGSPTGDATVVVTAAGRVLEVTFRATQKPESHSMEGQQQRPSQPPVRPVLADKGDLGSSGGTLSHSPFRGLPLCFQQTTLRGAGVVCDAVLNRIPLCDDTIADVSFFDPRPVLHDVAEHERGWLAAELHRGGTDAQTEEGVSPASGRPHVATNLVESERTPRSSPDDLWRLFEPLPTVPPRSTALLAESRVLDGAINPDRAIMSEATTETGMQVPACIELHLGNAHEEAFGGVVVLVDVSKLNTDVLRLAPITAVVESSLDEDGLLYQRRGQIALSTPVSHATWPECHVGRHWRLRFMTPLPEALGIVRVLWVRATWRTRDERVSPLRTLELSGEDAQVSIEATRVCTDRPESLLSGSDGGIFQVSDAPWLLRQAVLPLSPPETCEGTTRIQPCLVFSGDQFAEVDLTTGDVAGRRCCALRTHPAFAALPPAFHRGIDAAFYPPGASSGSAVVVLVSSGWQLHWNVRQGQAEGQMVRCSEGYLKGLPVQLSQVYSVCNAWNVDAEEDNSASTDTSSSSVWIVFAVHNGGQTETRVLQWSLAHQRVERGPSLVSDWAELNNPALADQPIQCLWRTPNGDTHVFANQRYYQFCTAAIGGSDHTLASSRQMRDEGPILEHARWYRLGWYLPHFAQPRFGASVMIDLLGCTHAILGYQLTSTQADNRAWKAAFSDDCLEWCEIPVSHRQRDTTTRTVWRPRDIRNRSHRFWRLSCVTSEGEASRACSYTGLTFLVLPSAVQRGHPERASLSGTSLVPLDKLLQNRSADVTAAFDAGSEVASLVPASYRVNHPGLSRRVHRILVDYGTHAAPLLTGFSLVVAQPCEHYRGATWAALCSDDGRDPASWQVCAVHHSPFTTVHLEWLVAQPHRYWCIEMHDGVQFGSVLIGQWMLQRYDGPLVTASSALSRGQAPYTGYSLLHADPHTILRPAPRDTDLPFALLLDCLSSNASDCIDESMDVPAQPGSVLEIRMPASSAGLALVGVEITCTSSTCTHATMQLQRSQDGLSWSEVARCQWLSGAASTLCRAEGHVGAAPFWRIHVLEANDAQGTLRFRHVALLTTEPHLYTHFHTISNPPSSTPLLPTGSLTGEASALLDLSVLSLNAPQAISQVSATLPPCTVYQVERLSLDGIAWESVTVLENSSVTHAKHVRRGWAALTPSTSWRLRSLTPVLSRGSGPLPSALTICTTLTSPGTLIGDVRWSAFASLQPVRVNLRALAGLVMTSSGFTEVEPIRVLCRAERDGPMRASPVLRCVPADAPLLEDPLIVWQFTSPTALHRAVLILHVTAPTPSQHASPKSQTSERTTVMLPPTVVVESSGNGIDYVAVAEVPMVPSQATQKHIFPVCVAWDPSNASCGSLEQPFWRLRFHSVPRKTTVDVVRVEWFTLHGAPLSAGSLLATAGAAALSAATNTVFGQWKQESFNTEAAFCLECRRGLEESSSLETKLRADGDCSRAGKTATTVAAKSKQFNKFIVKLAKNTAPGIPQLNESPFYSSGAERFRDLQYFLQQCGRTYPGARFDELVPLIGQPLPLRDLVYSKKQSLWFYPRFSVSGSVAEPFYGIARTHASFSVLWSLSFALQRNHDLTGNEQVDDVSPHIASPLVVVNIAHKDWQAAKSFPDLPLLYHVGFTACPMAVVFALNEMTFTEAYNLQIPDAKPFATAFPFSVYPGVNFVRRMPVAACPAPVFDHLKLLFPQSLLETEQTVVVFTVPSLHSRTAKVRFTLSAANVDVGLRAVSMEALQFEFTLALSAPDESPFTAKNLAALTSPKSPQSFSESFSVSLTGSEGAAAAETGSLSGTSSNGLPPKRRKARGGNGKPSPQSSGELMYTIHMVSRGAKYLLSAQTPLDASRPAKGCVVPHEEMVTPEYMPLSILCQLRPVTASTTPKLGVMCEAQCTNLPLKIFGRQGATLTHIRFGTSSSARLHSSHVSFVAPPAIPVSATLALPFGAAYPCSFMVATPSQFAAVQPDVIAVQMTHVTLHDVLVLLRWLFVDGRAFTAQFSPREEAWMMSLPLIMSLELSLVAASNSVTATGSLTYGTSSSQHVYVRANSLSWHLSCHMPSLRMGEIELGQAAPRLPTDTPRPVQLTLDGSYCSPTRQNASAGDKADAPCVHLAAQGETALLGEKSTGPLMLEVSCRGTFGTSTAESFTVTLEDLSDHAHLHRSLHVSLHEGVWLPLIVYELKRHPLVTSLLSAGLTFQLTPETLFMRDREPTPQRRLVLCFRGVFFGAWFDVAVPAAQLHAAARGNAPLCADIAAQVVEQCASTLWASYANLIGSSVPPSTHTGASPETASGAAVLQNHHASVGTQGSFLSFWVAKECAEMDERAS